MKLGKIVYNDELQIKFEFRCYWSIFDRVMGPWTLNFHENFCFPDIFWIIFSDIEHCLVTATVTQCLDVYTQV
jgi:hypothetical protein